MPSVDECADELMNIYARSRVYETSVELIRSPMEVAVTRRPTGLSLIVKSVHELSTDEIPIVNVLLERFDFSEIYEYERVVEAPEGDRAQHFATFLSEALADGRGVIVLVPSLMVVSLTSRLSEELAEELEEGALAEVSVKADNELYLPLRAAIGDSPIEIVAKANSRSSYERVRWLRGEAGRRGIRVSNEVYLPDNRSIADYVTSSGRRGYLYRVPVTRLASVLVALDRCSEADSVEEVRRPEAESHTLYAINITEEHAKRLVQVLAEISAMSRGAPFVTIGERLRPFFEKGSREVVAEVARKLGLI